MSCILFINIDFDLVVIFLSNISHIYLLHNFVHGCHLGSLLPSPLGHHPGPSCHSILPHCYPHTIATLTSFHCHFGYSYTITTKIGFKIGGFIFLDLEYQFKACELRFLVEVKRSNAVVTQKCFFKSGSIAHGFNIRDF